MNTALRIFFDCASIFSLSYLLIVVSHQKRVIAWCDAREVVMREVFQAARAIERHHYEADPDPVLEPGHASRFGDRQARTIYFKGNRLNYATLIDMVMTEQAQHELLVVAIDHVALWELDHPVPAPPTIFGWRLPLL